MAFSAYSQQASAQIGKKWTVQEIMIKGSVKLKITDGKWIRVIHTNWVRHCV